MSKKRDEAMRARGSWKWMPNLDLITFNTLDLRDTEVQRQFLAALKQYGVP